MRSRSTRLSSSDVHHHGTKPYLRFHQTTTNQPLSMAIQAKPSAPTRLADKVRSEPLLAASAEPLKVALWAPTVTAQQVYTRANDSAIAGTNDPNDE
jgi:hypothetical protein